MFYQKLQQASQKNQSLLCLGLDPDINRLPIHLSGGGGAIFNFCKQMVDACADLVCAFKPQIAYFSANQAEQQLEQLIDYIKNNYPHLPVILDAKRGDIDATSKQYAIEAFERYGADAVTLSPYMGIDTLEPFLEYENKAVFLLCKTSNKSGAWLQNAMIDGVPVYMKVAQLAKQYNQHKQLGLVIGATALEEMQKVRAFDEHIPFLIPGIGAQGGELEKSIEYGLNKDGFGAVLNVSRAILYASNQEDFLEKAREAALALHQQMPMIR